MTRNELIDDIAIAAICISFCAAPLIAKADINQSISLMLDVSEEECQNITDVDWYEDEGKEVYFVTCENNGRYKEIIITVE